MPIYPYQMDVFNHLMQGRNVIIQAPTGAGKTQAALYPFLTSLDPAPDNPWRGRLPTRCIYSVPMRVLAKQFRQKHKDPINRYSAQYRIEITQSIQMGEQPTDPQLTSNLIFATIDQTLSSYLLAPYSLGRRQANLNAGAVMSSYLVFDEFHLYDPVSTLPTTIHMLHALNGVTPFVLMTATFSETLLRELADLLGAVIVPGSQEERDGLDQLESQQKERGYQVIDEVISADVILNAHKHRSLVICNTVERARQLHWRLRELAPSETEVLLLHSQFLADDRNRVEDRIRELFGKEADRKVGSAIVVSTQAIEVGVDMSCQALHTELAPANAIIQRAGRCARYPNEKGTVYIYGKTFDPKDMDNEIDLTDGKHYLPYEKQAHLFPVTLEAFRAHQGILKFKDEQAILSQVHNADDTRLVAEIRQSGNNYSQRVFTVQRGDAADHARNLIRDIRQVQIIIHADPVGMLTRMTESPLLMPSFGLHPGSLAGYLKNWRERAEALDIWSVMYLHEYAEKSNDKRKPDEERAKPTMDELFKWVPVNTEGETQAAIYAPLVVVNPQLATYDPARGFVPDASGDWQSPPPERGDKAAWGSYTYHLETYADHIRRVHEAFVGLWPELAWAAARLEQQHGWQAGSIRQAAELAVLLHDVGKLSEKWQGWVREYQRLVAIADDNPEMEAQPGQAYAHTESTTPEHRAIEKRIGKRPWHAVEGALSALPVLNAMIDEPTLCKAAVAAIARHHAPFSDKHQPYRLIKIARQRMAETFAGTGYKPDFSALIDHAERELIHEFLPQPDDTDDQGAAFRAYLLIVRALRRADVEGTKAGRKL
jgi:CRISPR-associated endonuclease/helicase Cas3